MRLAWGEYTHRGAPAHAIPHCDACHDGLQRGADPRVEFDGEHGPARDRSRERHHTGARREHMNALRGRNVYASVPRQPVGLWNACQLHDASAVDGQNEHRSRIRRAGGCTRPDRGDGDERHENDPSGRMGRLHEPRLP
jgi:hypothetical protein